MAKAFINRIATAAPPHDVHETFLRFGQLMLAHDQRKLALFNRMAERSGIAHRYSFVQPDPGARVLAVNLELCSLHLHETDDLEEILSFLLFADGCAAALVTADPVGVEMKSFRAALVPDTKELIRWNIRQQGFDMVLSGGVPGAIRTALTNARDDILGGANDIELWAVHPGGRTAHSSMSLAPPNMSSRAFVSAVRMAPGTPPDSTMSKPCWRIFQRINSFVSGTSAARKD